MPLAARGLGLQGLHVYAAYTILAAASAGLKSTNCVWVCCRPAVAPPTQCIHLLPPCRLRMSVSWMRLMISVSRATPRRRRPTGTPRANCCSRRLLLYLVARLPARDERARCAATTLAPEQPGAQRVDSACVLSFIHSGMQLIQVQPAPRDIWRDSSCQSS
jgi:hypothetical protein